MSHPLKGHKGFGDTVEAFTKSTGIKAIVEATSKATNTPCGCDKRRKTLNEIFHYGKK